MQIDTAAAIDLSKEKKQNESSFSDQMKAYIKHPGSGVLALLTLLGAVLTFALLFFLIGYILVKGVPYLSTDLFSLTYNSENLSLLPSLINTFILTVVSLVIAAPLGIFAAFFHCFIAFISEYKFLFYLLLFHYKMIQSLFYAASC